jgi:histidine ammonia-lyase
MIVLGENRLDIHAFDQIILQGRPVSVSAEALKSVRANFDFLVSFAHGKVIYGVNTGFGPMAQYRIEDSNIEILQYNLIRSHCSGMGTPLSETHTRALMVARLNTLSLGYSGIHPDTIALLSELINNGVYPIIYSHGGVGASGDLVQLAHLALGMLGEGLANYKGDIIKTHDALDHLSLPRLKIRMREGLAIMNGTSAMTGIGAVNVILANRLVLWGVLLSVMCNEVSEAFTDHFSEELNAVKHHPGQHTVASWMRVLSADGALLRSRNEHLYNASVTSSIIEDRVQEYYSLRCVPQILGAVLDTVRNAQTTVVDELNSVSDNPVVSQFES